MVARIAGETVYLWRAVDHEGEVLDIPCSADATKRRPEADAQAPQEAGLRTGRHRDGQVAIVCSGVRGA